MIVHICPDEKFILQFVVNFEKYGSINGHRFFLRTNTGIVESPFVQRIKLNSKIVKTTISSLTKDDLLLVHFLDYQTLAWLVRVKTKAHIGWVFWGAVFYQTLSYKSQDYNLYDSQTKQIINSNKGRSFLLRNFLGKVLMKGFNYVRHRISDFHFKKVLARLDVFYHFNQFDFDLVKNTYETKAQLVHFHYSNFSRFLESYKPEETLLEKTKHEKFRIMVGNSGSTTNNHLDVLNLINAAKLNNIEIHMPLSYGKKSYILEVIKTSQQRLPKSFHPLTKFLDFDSYFDYLRSMDVCIMGHNRAEGLGNILVLLFLGKKVYLKPHTTAFQYYEHLGMKIFKLDNDISGDSLKQPLSHKDIAHNKTLCKEHFGTESVKQIYSDLF